MAKLGDRYNTNTQNTGKYNGGLILKMYKITVNFGGPFCDH